MCSLKMVSILRKDLESRRYHVHQGSASSCVLYTRVAGLSLRLRATSPVSYSGGGTVGLSCAVVILVRTAVNLKAESDEDVEALLLLLLLLVTMTATRITMVTMRTMVMSACKNNTNKLWATVQQSAASLR